MLTRAAGEGVAAAAAVVGVVMSEVVVGTVLQVGDEDAAANFVMPLCA